MLRKFSPAAKNADYTFCDVRMKVRTSSLHTKIYTKKRIHVFVRTQRFSRFRLPVFFCGFSRAARRSRFPPTLTSLLHLYTEGKLTGDGVLMKFEENSDWQDGREFGIKLRAIQLLQFTPDVSAFRLHSAAIFAGWRMQNASIQRRTCRVVYLQNKERIKKKTSYFTATFKRDRKRIKTC